MMRKTIFVMLCLSPLAANADIIYIPSTPDNGFGDAPFYTADGLSATDNTYVFEYGQSLTLGSGGVQIDHDFYVGRANNAPLDGGYVYIAPSTDTTTTANPFTLRSDGDVSVDGMLWVDTGLYIGVQTGGTKINNATFGGINATGALQIEDVNNLTVTTGSITSASNLNISAGVINVNGGVSLGGTTNIVATGSMSVGGLTAGSDNVSTDITLGGSANPQNLVVTKPATGSGPDVTGNIQNLAGEMIINTNGGNITADNIENSGTLMVLGGVRGSNGIQALDVGAITVAGTMKNDNADGTLKINAASLTVNGADLNSLTNTGASLVLTGNFEATIAGTTHLENGFAWGGAQTDRTFYLKTGELTFGSNVADAWTVFLDNNLNSFYVEIANSGVDTDSNIVNGENNQDADMDVIAQSISVGTVTNYGNLLLQTNEGSGGDIVIGANEPQGGPNTILTGIAGSETHISADGLLNINGSVSNRGDMSLNGDTMSVVGISNSGTLDVSVSTDAGGKLTVAGNVTTTESGTTNISGRDVSIAGIVESKGGTTTISASDSEGGALIIGGLDVDAGNVNLNALIGSVNISNNIDIDGGAVNIGNSTKLLDVAGTVDIVGDFTLSDTNAQDGGMNVAYLNNNNDGGFTLRSQSGTITIGGNVLANVTGRAAVFDATNITIGTANDTGVLGGNVSASAGTHLTFGTDTTDITTDGSLNVLGNMVADSGAIIEIYSGTTQVASLGGNGKYVMHGNHLTATTGTIEINGDLRFDGQNPTQMTNGMAIVGTNSFDLTTQVDSINVNGEITVAAGNTLSINSAADFTTLALGMGGTLRIDAVGNANLGDVSSSGDLIVGFNSAIGGNINVGSLNTSSNDGSTVKLNSALDITVKTIQNNGGDVSLIGKNIKINESIENGYDNLLPDSIAKLTIDASDDVNIVGGISNNAKGELTINGVNVSIGNYIHNGGTITIGADGGAVKLSGVDNSNTLFNDENSIFSVGGATTTTISTAGGVSNANGSTVSFVANGDISIGGNIVNNGTSVILNSLTGSVSAGTISTNAGTTGITGTSVDIDALTVSDGAVANIYSSNITSEYDVRVMGNVIQGASASGSEIGALNFENDNTALSARNFVVTGNFIANAGTSGEYTIGQNVQFDSFNVAGGANVNITAGNTIETDDLENRGNLKLVATNGSVSMADITNSGMADILSGASITGDILNNSDNMSLVAASGINLTQVINTGALTLDSGKGITTVDAPFTMGDTGRLILSGVGLTTWADVSRAENAMFSTSRTLYQNYAGNIINGDINVKSDKYTITASGINVAEINQISGRMDINASTIDVSGSISASDLRFAANPSANWMTVNVGGSVSGGVEFIGLESMNIGNDYVLNDSSIISAAILGRDSEKYWATVSLADDKTLGEITNTSGEDASALITVGGELISDFSTVNRDDLPSTNSPLTIPQTQASIADGQIGITLFDTVDQGSAIWLLHADGGIREGESVNGNILNKLRNLNVKFCNADGSICINYLDTLNKYPDSKYNVSDTNLPAYISARDTDGDGNPDSLYIVFDPRFGGPVEVFKIQPVVAKVEPHTVGEYVSAGALDNLIEGQLFQTKFYNSNPIELIPEIFKNTNMAEMARELYDRMEYYNMSRDGVSLARFSRLFQVRELEQVAGSIELNEHTNFRSFEDRMFDEFIWNRNRSLRKAWADFEFGMFSQNVSDDKRVYGNRFSVSGGFDWQHSETLILGLTARASNMDSDNSDSVVLGYKGYAKGENFVGNMNVNVANTNIGVGGYMMKIFGEKTRMYGNAFLDVHLFDISRNQNFVNKISGNGTAFSLISEWGLMHDWLNQYIVGNIYARVGYNTGFSITEQADGLDYMNLESDGYFIVTPGYSLIAQKRIYPSAWFQIRPYLSVGVEYDVLGAPDFAKYKFAPAAVFTQYDIDLDPLWVNGGGGIEFLSASGFQMGIDYRYQYNNAIQLHNIKASLSYRF